MLHRCLTLAAGISLAMLTGAMAEPSFPAGSSGNGNLGAFPGWQRILAEVTPLQPVAREAVAAASPDVSPDTSEDVSGDADAPAVAAAADGENAPPAESMDTPSIAEMQASDTAFDPPSPSAFGMRPIPDEPAETAAPDGANSDPADETSSETAAPARKDAQARWRDMIGTARGLAPLAQLDAVNRWANAISYVEDRANWAVADYWQTPAEFIENGGDCEDFAIAKYFSLTALGFDAADLRILVLFDEGIRMHHAVLLVRAAGEVWMLDNQKETVTRFSDAQGYRPIYSVNEGNWWLHKTLTPVRLTAVRTTQDAPRNRARLRLP